MVLPSPWLHTTASVTLPSLTTFTSQAHHRTVSSLCIQRTERHSHYPGVDTALYTLKGQNEPMPGCPYAQSSFRSLEMEHEFYLQHTLAECRTHEGKTFCTQERRITKLSLPSEH